MFEGKLNFIKLKQQLHNYVIAIAEKYIALAYNILDFRFCEKSAPVRFWRCPTLKHPPSR